MGIQNRHAVLEHTARELCSGKGLYSLGLLSHESQALPASILLYQQTQVKNFDCGFFKSANTNFSLMEVIQNAEFLERICPHYKVALASELSPSVPCHPMLLANL